LVSLDRKWAVTRETEGGEHMFKPIKSAVALGVPVALAVGALAGAPTAAACPIDADGNCLVTRHVVRAPAPAAKPKHAKAKKAAIRHQR
jgi:hypothetical protein